MLYEFTTSISTVYYKILRIKNDSLPPPQVVLHSVNSLYIQLYPLDSVCFTASVGMLYSYSIPGLTSWYSNYSAICNIQLFKKKKYWYIHLQNVYLKINSFHYVFKLNQNYEKYSEKSIKINWYLDFYKVRN